MKVLKARRSTQAQMGEFLLFFAGEFRPNKTQGSRFGMPPPGLDALRAPPRCMRVYSCSPTASIRKSATSKLQHVVLPTRWIPASRAVKSQLHAMSDRLNEILSTDGEAACRVPGHARLPLASTVSLCGSPSSS